MEQAKKDYEALNDQLVEDLPKLTKASTRIYLTSIERLMTSTRNFYALIKLDLKEQNQVIILLENDLKQNELNFNYLRIQKSELKFTSHHHHQRRIPKLEISFQRNTSIFFTQDDEFFNSNGISKKQTDDHILNLKRNYPAENLYRGFFK